MDNVRNNCRTVAEPINDVDTEMAISKSENRKATGHDQIPTVLIKERGTGLKKVIYELISNTCEEETIPHEWKCDIIYPVHEKGDVMMCDNYRAATLLCTTCKILENILYSKLLSYAEEIIGEYQGGFQRGRSTSDQIFTVRRILGNCWDQNIAVHHLCINFQVEHNTAWREEYGVKCISWFLPPSTKKLINSCRIRDNEIYVKVKIGKHLSFECEVNKGWR